MSLSEKRLLKQAKKSQKRTLDQRLFLKDKRYYEFKGKVAEEVLHMLAQKTFLTDWCYLNPMLSSGKELCDLLVVFDDTAIIWQLKDVKLDKTLHIKEKDYRKNIRQTLGAYRHLSQLKTSVELINPRRGKERFDSSKIKHYYLISSFFGDVPFTLNAIENAKDKFLHVFNREFTEIILNELDTISDFMKYLSEKERFFSLSNAEFLINGGEEELLAYYIFNDKSFNRLLEGNYEAIMMEGGVWDDLKSRQEYKAKCNADKISYLWDDLIDKCHTGDNNEYEKIARELARFNRFDRRNLSIAFTELGRKANQGVCGYAYRRTLQILGVTCCFLCYGDSNDCKSRELRKKLLEAFCFIARGTLGNSKVVGIATDQSTKKEIAFDFCLFDIPDWTDDHQIKMELLQKDTKMLTKPTQYIKRFTEYPQV